MKHLFIFSIIILTISCTNKPKKQDDIYVIIDELLRYELYDADLVILEFNKVNKNNIITINSTGDTLYESPPSPAYVQYDNHFFKYLNKKGFLTSNEADYMYMQIDSFKDIALDSSKIEKQYIRNSKLQQLFNKIGTDSGYKYLEKTYKAQSFIRFSTPLFSENGNKLLLTVDFHCGGLCGGGDTYLFEKKNDKWRIIYKNTNWIS